MNKINHARRWAASWLCVVAASILFGGMALAQSTATPTVDGYLTTSGCPSGQTTCFVQYGATVPISGTISASLGSFAPTGQASLAAGTTTSNVALGSVGPTALVTNNGAVTAFINFGSSGVTATTSGYPVNAGQSIAFNVGSNTYIAGITGSSTAALAITTGTGLPAIAGGGSGGGGGGGTSGTFGVAFPSTGTPIGVTNGTNMVSVTGDGTGMDVIGEGTAGSPAGGIVTVQGAAGGTGLPASLADGASVTLGSKADAAWSSGSGSEISILKKMDADIQGGAGTIGSAVPTTGIYAAGESSGNLVGLIQADNTVNISVASTTSQIIALSAGKKTYITHIDFTTSAAQVVTVEYGTGTNCGTVVGVLDAHQLAANGGVSSGGGLGPVLIVPVSDEVCIISTSGTTTGSVAYTQF